MSAALAVQALLRARLANDPVVTSLVTPSAIVDSNRRPDLASGIGSELSSNVLRSLVLIGDGQVIFDRPHETYHVEVYADVHTFIVEPGLVGAKTLVEAIRKALRDRPWTMADYRCLELHAVSARFLRDPSGEHSHGVLSLRAIMQETTP